MLEWVSVSVAAVGVAAGVIGSMSAVYAKAATADNARDIAVLQARLEDASKRVDANYTYCHESMHKTNNFVANVNARMCIVEHVMKLPSP